MTQPSPTPETQEERTARHLNTLREITDLARNLAFKAAYDATHQPPEPQLHLDARPKPRPQADPRLAFERLARTIRDLITLERRIAGQPALAQQAADPAPANPNEDPSLTTQDDLATFGRLSRHDRRAMEKRLRTARP
jgi:hypothetical protein